MICYFLIIKTTFSIEDNSKSSTILPFHAYSLEHCNCTRKVLKFLQNQAWNPTYLHFLKCDIGNQIAEKLSSQIDRIICLTVYCDPISNTGVKKLIRLNLPQLRKLFLANCNITSSVVKLLTKKYKPGYDLLDVLFQQKFDHTAFYKNIHHFKVAETLDPIQFKIVNYDRKIRVMYLGHLCKVRQETASSSILIMRS